MITELSIWIEAEKAAFLSAPPPVRAEILADVERLANSVEYPETRDWNAALLAALQSENLLMPTPPAQQSPAFPAPTWAETFEVASWIARPVFIAATIGGIGYAIVSALIGVGQGVMAWASANGGWIVAGVLGGALLYGLKGNVSWGRGEEGETTKETFTETEYFRHTEYTKETTK